MGLTTLARADSPPSLRVGDSVSVKVELKQPHSEGPLQASLPTPASLPADALPHTLEDVGFKLLSPQVEPDGTVRLSVVKAGNLNLPPLTVKNKKGEEVGQTQPLSVAVVSAITSTDPKPKEPEGLVPPVGLPFPLWVVVAFGILGVLVLLACLYGLFRLWKKYRPKKKAAPVLDVPEDVQALKELEELEKEALLQKNQFKAHSFKVSEILKKYLGRRFYFDALESTTAEMFHYFAESRPLSPLLIDLVRALFEKLDRVKFTDFVPPPEESKTLIEEARVIIKQTRRPTILAHAEAKGGSLVVKSGVS